MHNAHMSRTNNKDKTRFFHVQFALVFNSIKLIMNGLVKIQLHDFSNNKKCAA